MRFIYSLLVLILFFPLLSIGQNLKGYLHDETNSPVVDAYVMHLQSEHHTHSNEFGNFLLIDAKVGDTLKIMHIGYETLILPIKDVLKPLNIELRSTFLELGEIVVGQNIKKSNIISYIDTKILPVSSSQEILRKVPGLFIGQHAGGGKAEQIFLRGFDIDHGTDVQITVDGMPVNMVSHAHGQGYSDLHFLIPETIESIDFGKGPYYGDKGNFATAGYVSFATKEKLKSSELNLSFGQYGALRTVGLFKVLDTDKSDLYFASEYSISNGAFESPQNFSRINFMTKFTTKLNALDKFSVSASHFTSKWDASGQIPQREVNAGRIGRFGAIDDTEGGFTGRTNLAVSYNRSIDDHIFIKNNFYYSLYDFELYSNFTFFLNDPVNGDQIRQKENRQIFGFESTWNKILSTEKTSGLIQIGIGLRDDITEGSELSSTVNRKTTLHNIQLGDVDEKNMYAFSRLELDVGNWLFEPSVRLDVLKFNYVNALDSVFIRRGKTKAIVSPKFNIVYNLNAGTQFFFKSGIGFHSNDTRVILGQEDKVALPAAYGLDLGAILKPTRKMVMNVALWYLLSEQEFVYVGDAGVVELSGKSQRLGVDLGIRYQINNWLFATMDANYAHPRSLDEPEGNNLIPLAPTFTSTASLSIKRKKILSSLQFRYLKDRPATPDNSIIAEGYFITDFSASYNLKKISIGFSIENLFNQEWNETQFATQSRLKYESNSVEEIHFTPGTPFFIKGILKYKF